MSVKHENDYYQTDAHLPASAELREEATSFILWTSGRLCKCIVSSSLLETQDCVPEHRQNTLTQGHTVTSIHLMLVAIPLGRFSSAVKSCALLSSTNVSGRSGCCRDWACTLSRTHWRCSLMFSSLKLLTVCNNCKEQIKQSYLNVIIVGNDHYTLSLPVSEDSHTLGPSPRMGAIYLL